MNYLQDLSVLGYIRFNKIGTHKSELLFLPLVRKITKFELQSSILFCLLQHEILMYFLY